MKKVLALVLAVMMMATVAFATTQVEEDANTVAFGGKYAPGDTLYVYRNMGGDVDNWSEVTPGTAGWNAEITSANYGKPTSQKWTQGRELLAGLEFDDKNNQLKIKLTEDYTLKQPKRLVGSFVLKGKGKGGVDSGDPDRKAVKPTTIKVKIDIEIGNWKQQVNVNPDNDVTLATGGNAAAKDGSGITDGELIHSPAASCAHTSPTAVTHVPSDDIWDNAVQKISGDYGNIVLECADEKDTEVTFRAYKNDEYFLHNDTDADNALLKAYADQDAEISFLNFPSNQTLNSTATIRFYKDEDSHVYVLKNGKLASEVKWDDDEACFVLKTRTLGSYVFSDKKLNVSASTAADNNPDTGANDVVGIATALAAVALVSAAAVSLKK